MNEERGSPDHLTQRPRLSQREASSDLESLPDDGAYLGVVFVVIIAVVVVILAMGWR